MDSAELQPNLTLLVRREYGHNTRYGLGGIERVERRHDQVTGLRGQQCGLDRFEVPHFTHQNDVGVLSQRRLQSLAEGERVDADLALIDHRTLVTDEELDRVFDGHHVDRFRSS